MSYQRSAVSGQDLQDGVLLLDTFHQGAGLVKNFRDLKVWEKAHQISLAIYRVTTQFPKEERYGLTNQIRRCCASIPANIAEECGRRSQAEFSHFLNIAMGSASELEYHLLLANELEYLKSLNYKPLAQEVTEVKRMLTGLIKKLKADG